MKFKLTPTLKITLLLLVLCLVYLYFTVYFEGADPTNWVATKVNSSVKYTGPGSLPTTIGTLPGLKLASNLNTCSITKPNANINDSSITNILTNTGSDTTGNSPNKVCGSYKSIVLPGSTTAGNLICDMSGTSSKFTGICNSGDGKNFYLVAGP